VAYVSLSTLNRWHGHVKWYPFHRTKEPIRIPMIDPKCSAEDAMKAMDAAIPRFMQGLLKGLLQSMHGLKLTAIPSLDERCIKWISGGAARRPRIKVTRDGSVILGDTRVGRVARVHKEGGLGATTWRNQMVGCQPSVNLYPRRCDAVQALVEEWLRTTGRCYE